MCMHARFLLCKIEELMETVTLELTKSLSCTRISFFYLMRNVSRAHAKVFLFFLQMPL